MGATVNDGVSNVGGNSSAIAKAAAINAVSGQTGVSATVQATNVAGSAVDGAGFATAIADGDITVNGVSIGALAAAGSISERGSQVAAAVNAKSSQTGVTATFDTTTGAVALTAADGRNVTVANNGTATGVAANVSGLGSTTVGVVGTTTRSSVTLNSTNQAGITIGNGGGTGTGASAAITSFGAIASGDLKINGVNIGAVAAGTDVDTQGANLLAAINAQTAATGVTATYATGVLSLESTTAGSGTAITVTAKNSASTATTGFAAGDTTFAGKGAAAAGLTAGTTASTASAGAGVSSLDLTTATGAQAALTTIDAAINTINSTRGALGAYQNRFESTVASLQTTTENLSASRSRIRDADFAKETANLTRSQILQQAGTAILSQANQLGQGVLSLLR